MSELRLVPAALIVWLVSLAVICFGPAAAAGVLVVGCVALVCVHQRGQAILAGGLGACGLCLTWVRMAAAKSHELGSEVAGSGVVGTVRDAPEQMDSGDWFLRVVVDGYPAPVPVFCETLPDEVAPGAVVEVAGTVSESGRAGVGAHAVNGAVEIVEAPQGFSAIAVTVRERFSQAVVEAVGEHSQGLIPGMVLGDTTLQSAEEEQDYVVTGLSHLSAVSGQNCTYVATAALLVARLCRLGLRAQLAWAGLALIVYAGLVGTEPSVLRATATGLVGFLAIVGSTRAEPVHALSLAVIGLILVDSDLAVSYGFALSVAATVGIVAVSPLIYRALAPTGWPDIVVRALSVAIAADVATAPIIAGMAGRVSLVAAAANVLVSPFTGVITVVGMLAAILAQLSQVVAYPLLWLIQPMTWWIRTVAEVGAGLPGTTIEASPIAVIVAYGWIMAGFFLRRSLLTLGTAVCIVVAVQVMGSTVGAGPWTRVVDSASLSAHVVDTEDDIEPVPDGTQLVVVLDPGGRPHERPVVTRTGVPVIYPNRDGKVDIFSDGSQRSRAGHF